MHPQLTEPVASALQKGVEMAGELRQTEVTDLHLLAAFCQEAEGYFGLLAKQLGLNIEQLQTEVNSALKKLPTYVGEAKQPTPSSSLQAFLFEAQNIAKAMQDIFIATDHCFLTFWKGKTEPFSSWKSKVRLSTNEVEKKIKELRGDQKIGFRECRARSCNADKILQKPNRAGPKRQARSGHRAR